ncbi:MAG: hypothetical protein ACYYKD_02475 [Rhodospirillales bacterium]
MAKYSKYKKTADGIIITSIKAMTKMAEEYSLSGKWNWYDVAPWATPEYLYTVAIAQKLARPAKRGVYLENNIPKEVRAAKKTRCDIAVMDGKSADMRLCLEVKTNFNNVGEDVDACRKIIRNKKTKNLQDAAVVFMAFTKNKKTLEKGYNNWCDNRLDDNERIVALDSKGFVVKSSGKIKFRKYKQPNGTLWYWYVGAIQMSLPDK